MCVGASLVIHHLKDAHRSSYIMDEQQNGPGRRVGKICMRLMRPLCETATRGSRSFLFSWRSSENKAIRQLGKCGCNVCCLAGLISLAAIIAAALFLHVASVNKNSLARQYMSVQCSCRHQQQFLLLYLCKHKIYNLWRMSFVSSPLVLLGYSECENVYTFTFGL